MELFTRQFVEFGGQCGQAIRRILNIRWYHYLYSTSYTGSRLRVGYATNYAAWCTESTTILLLHTYQNYVFIAVSRLQLTSRGNYVIPRTHKHLANRVFAVAALSSWNSLPDYVHDSQSYSNFVSKLKTHYFKLTLHFITISTVNCTIILTFILLCMAPLSYGWVL